jgi:hypothetical protein
MLVLSIVGVLAGVISAWIAYDGYLHRRNRRLKFNWQSLGIRIVDIRQETLKADDSPLVSAGDLLQYFWDYPITQKTQSFAEQSWAVKESLILKGNLLEGREKPGLGCAILSVRFALEVFGEAAAKGRIDQVVEWAMRRTDKVHPHLLIDSIFVPTDSTTQQIKDFRHTLAFAEILAMTGRAPSYRDGYLEHTLDKQRERRDGGWNAGENATVSELLTVLYAVIFLGTCKQRVRLSSDKHKEVDEAMNLGISWIVEAASESHLWNIEYLRGQSWNEVLTTAFVLRGMSILGSVPNHSWNQCAGAAQKSLVTATLDQATWKNIDGPLQHFRIESRIGASIARRQQSWATSATTHDQIDAYLGGWRVRGMGQLKKTPPSELDLSTVMYWLESAYSIDELRSAATLILENERKVQSKEK